MPIKQAVTLQREKQLIILLQDNEYSIKALADATGMHYYTVRRLVEDLVARGIIKVSRTLNRERMYVYNAEHIDEADFIPRLTDMLNKSTTKAIYLIEGVGQEDAMRSTQAAKALIKHVVDLMMCASNASHGADITFRLNLIRETMQKDFLYLKNATYLYEQILKEPRFWSKEFLQEMVDDKDYNFSEVAKAADYYDSL